MGTPAHRCALYGTRHALLLGAALGVGGFGPAQIFAQANTSSVSGRVVDANGAAVAGATVAMRNTDQGSTRTLTGGNDGSFRVTGLPSGSYTVEGRASGLVTRHPVRLTLTLGSNTDVVLRLGLAPVQQKTTVNARPATVEGNTTAPPPNTAARK